MQNAAEFIVNKNLSAAQLTFHPPTGSSSWIIDPLLMLQAVIKTNGDILLQMKQNRDWEDMGIPALLKHIPLKNLSGAIGECLGSNYCRLCPHDIRRNPHEAGSPDFLPYFTGTEKWIKEPTKTTYKTGGFDAKGVKISGLKFMEVDASSHHDQTTTILVSAWQEIDGEPQIVGCFYTNELLNSDWKVGSIPKNNGSKPTSSAQLLISGLDKLRRGWIVLHESVTMPRRANDVLKYGLQLLAERSGN